MVVIQSLCAGVRGPGGTTLQRIQSLVPVNTSVLRHQAASCRTGGTRAAATAAAPGAAAGMDQQTQQDSEQDAKKVLRRQLKKKLRSLTSENMQQQSE
jgi:hypothetical protein